MRYFNPKTALWAMLSTFAIASLPFLKQASAQTPTSTASSRLISQRPPVPPSDPPPNGTQPGGGLDPTARLSCTPANNALRALVPVKNPVFTTTNQPTVFFYVPLGSDQVQFGEFSLLSYPKEQQRIYTVRFTLPQTPGIVSVTVPPRSESPLKQGEYYRWYFQLYCRDGNQKQPDLTVYGLLQRVELTAQRERQISAATPDIWYDALAHVATQLKTSPQNSSLRNQWHSLLRTIKAEHLVQEQLLGPVIPIEQEATAPKP